MRAWPKHPIIYEINTWVWLNELSREYNRHITLATVPPEEWNALASLGVDAIWFMGVWERSPVGGQVARESQGIMADCRRALPDLRPEDIVGSPYCVRKYVVDDHLGGPAGLAVARRMLAERGVRLVLDFVPNHVAPDHPWVLEHPEYFVRGTAADAHHDPASYFEAAGNVFARGRDPYFPAWPDVLQLNAFDPGLRRSVLETIAAIADQCDGIRCDMAMLVMNAIFEQTWGQRAGEKPRGDYWTTLIPAIKSRYPDFKFVAEAYWDLEWELQQQGFDYCYDKRLYDRLEHGNAERIRQHLLADVAYQERLVRFIENHDEPRAAATFPPEKERAAAVTTLTLAGARLLHEGQFEGRKVRLPVFLGRRPAEPVDHELQAFFYQVLGATNRDVFRNGAWCLCERSGWPDNASYVNLVAWCWAGSDDRYLVVVNLGDGRAQGRVQLPWPELRGRNWTLSAPHPLIDLRVERSGDEMLHPGLYVDLAPWSWHFFRLQPV